MPPGCWACMYSRERSHFIYNVRNNTSKESYEETYFLDARKKEHIASQDENSDVNSNRPLVPRWLSYRDNNRYLLG